MLHKANQIWSAHLNGNDNAIDKILPKFYQDPIESQKAEGECNIFNILNVFLAKYSYSNIDDVTM